MNAKTQILIVEDDRDSLFGLNVLLTKNGYAVTSAEDANRAVSLAKQAAPDLVILDLGLPAGGGEFVLEKFRNDLKLFATPVIILSARPVEESASIVEEFRLSAYLRKPAGNELILQSVENALRGVPALSELSPDLGSTL